MRNTFLKIILCFGLIFTFSFANGKSLKLNDELAIKSKSELINVNAVCTPPTLTVINPLIGCPLTPVDLTSNQIITANTGIITTFWQDANATQPLDYATGAEYSVQKAGTYYIKSETSDPTCFTIKPVVVSHRANPIPAQKDTSACSYNSVTITYPIRAGISYFWPNRGETSNSVIVYPNSYVPQTVYIYDTFGCQHIDEFFILEKDTPSPTTAFLCKETEYNFYEIANYLFLSGPTNVIIQSDRVLGLTKVGEYKFEVSKPSGCKSDVSITKENVDFRAEIIQPTCDANGKPQNNGKIKLYPALNSTFSRVELNIGYTYQFFSSELIDIPASNEIYSILGNTNQRTAIRLSMIDTGPNVSCSMDTILYIEASACGETKGSIGNYVFEDMNGDGLQDAGDKPLRGVVMKLYDENNQLLGTETTDINGKYLFENLRTAYYSVRADTPLGFLNTKGEKYFGFNVDIDADNSVYQHTTENSSVGYHLLSPYLGGRFKDLLNIDFGYYKPVSIGDFVWNDRNKNGLQDSFEPGIEVEVVISGKAIDDTYIDSRFSSSVNGRYFHTGLQPGNYSISLYNLPSDFKPTLFNVGTDDSKNSDYSTDFPPKTVFLQSGQVYNSLDAGLDITPGTNVIEVETWIDYSNNNYINDIDGRANDIVAFLWELDFNGNLLRKIDTAVYIENKLSFKNVDFGKFKVEIPLALIPNQYTGFVEKDISGNLRDEIDSDFFQSTGFSDIIEFNRIPYCCGKFLQAGFKPKVIPKASFEGFLYNDKNMNNLIDSLDNGLQNVKVVLYSYLNNPNGIAIDSTLSDINGKFNFTADVGYYQLKIIKPEGLGSDLSLNPFVSLSVSWLITGPINIGFYQNAKIESFVWDDANGNGIQDIGEKGIPNVEVSFATGVTFQTYYTNQNGFFKIENIRPGQFSISVKFPNGYTLTKSNQGTNDDVDSDFIDQQYEFPSGGFLSTSISSGQFNLSLDFGLIRLTKIGNYVWEDSNLNGIQDISEKPIKNVYISLNGIDGIGKPISRITNTDSSGIYIFSNIFPGKYKVSFRKPAGYDATYSNVGIDSLDSDMINLQSPEFNISSGVDQLTIDAGFYKYCEPPKLELGRHPILCTPLTADLTSLNIINQNTGSITSYWQNYEATIPLDASTGPPDAIKKSGLYYVKSSFQDQNCFQTKSIDVFIQTCQTKVKGKVYLEGFWNGTNMRTDLLNKNLLPKSQPFNSEPWNYFGTEKAINFPLNVTDWILLVIRTDDGRVFDKKPAFVRNDGVLIDIFGAEGVSVGNYSNGFKASIHSKNHLGVMAFNSATSNIFMDLTKDPASVIGVNQLKQIGSNWFLHAGDLDGNGIINSLDFNKWKTKAATVNQYLSADIDGNGIVNNLDYNLWTKNRSKVGVYQIRGF